MVSFITGLKGSGKTKRLIEMVKKAVEEEQGDVICLEKGPKLTHDIPHKARLISITQYQFGSYDFLKGFISGLNASNYDVSHVFLDSLQKYVTDDSQESLEDFLSFLSGFSEKTGMKFTITYSADPSTLSEGILTYCS